MMLRLALIAMLVGLLIAGLTPFEFTPENRVNWSIPGPGVQFRIPGAAHSEFSVETGRSRAPEALTVHLLVEANELVDSRVATLLTLVDGNDPAPLVFGQWMDTFLIRLRDPSAEPGGYREVRAPGSLAVGKQMLLSVRIDPARGTTIFAGDAAHPRTFLRSEALPVDSFEGRLLLGCREDGSGFWRGRFMGLVVLEGAPSNPEIYHARERLRRDGFGSFARAPGVIGLYLFDEGSGESVRNLASAGGLGPLSMPRIFTPLAPRFLFLPKLEALLSHSFRSDIVLNLLGFIPFGILTAHWLRGRGRVGRVRIIVLTLLLGAFLSFFIELVQYWIPARRSTLTDLVLNTLGAMLGASLALLRRR